MALAQIRRSRSELGKQPVEVRYDRESPADRGRNRGMVVGETLEFAMMFGVVLAGLGLLVLLQRWLGTN